MLGYSDIYFLNFEQLVDLRNDFTINKEAAILIQYCFLLSFIKETFNKNNALLKAFFFTKTSSISQKKAAIIL